MVARYYKQDFKKPNRLRRMDLDIRIREKERKMNKLTIFDPE
jgi:hypothetical protein